MTNASREFRKDVILIRSEIDFTSRLTSTLHSNGQRGIPVTFVHTLPVALEQWKCVKFRIWCANYKA